MKLIIKFQNGKKLIISKWQKKINYEYSKLTKKKTKTCKITKFKAYKITKL